MENNFKKLNIDKTYILDGSIGNYLEVNHPELLDKNLWTTNFNQEINSNILSKLYEDYIKAGANIITTNTFRTNPISVIKNNIDSKLEVRKACNICLNLKDSYKNILIAGSNPPAEDCYKKERSIKFEALKDNHINHINYLIENKVDFVLNETISHMDEIDIILKHSLNTNINFALSLYFTENKGKFNLLDGSDFIDSIKYITDLTASHDKFEFISFNCISISIFNNLMSYTGIDSILNSVNWGFYLNNHDNEILEYKSILSKLIKKPIIIGGCCYVYSDQIKIISSLL